MTEEQKWLKKRVVLPQQPTTGAVFGKLPSLSKVSKPGYDGKHTRPLARDITPPNPFDPKLPKRTKQAFLAKSVKKKSKSQKA